MFTEADNGGRFSCAEKLGSEAQRMALELGRSRQRSPEYSLAHVEPSTTLEGRIQMRCARHILAHAFTTGAH